jgi:hypothetical protein
MDADVLVAREKQIPRFARNDKEWGRGITGAGNA